MTCKISSLVLLCAELVILVCMLSQSTSAAPTGRCSYTSEQYQTIVFSMCTSHLKKRSVNQPSTNNIAVADIERLEKMGIHVEAEEHRVKRSDTTLHLIVTYCYNNCCTYDRLEYICGSSSS